MSGFGPTSVPLLSLLTAGGPLPLLLAGCLLIPIAWIFLARRLDATTYARNADVRDRLWLRLVGGAALGEVSVYATTAGLNFAATGNTLPLLVPFSLPSAFLLGTMLGAMCGAVSARRHWRAEGVIAYLGLGFLAIGFIEYALATLRATALGPAWGLALFFLVTELFGMALLMLYQFYTLEFLAGSSPRPPPMTRPAGEGGLPYVAVQVACYNEPPEIVEPCLLSVRALDYPADRLHVQLLDDSTELRTQAALQALCQRLGFEYRHRSHRRGFKAGALNDGTAALPRRTELIAVIDADYRVAPDFLLRTAPFFRDAGIAWVQTPQSYWNEEESAFTRLYSLADAYFYRVIQPVRHAANSSIFCGTMGVLRRRALEQVCGWDESCITEDAEVSLRLYAAGWRSEYLTETLGAGMAPNRFPALQSQFSRWAFGGLQLLRHNLVTLRSPRLSVRQRLDFLVSGVFWMDGIFILLMAAGVLALMAAVWTGVAWSVPS
ncbi:MAG: glycosyltransferase family 2 protein, partial [Thermoplasmata archaeon]